MIATTIRLDSSIDLNDVAGNDGFLFVRNGVGFAGRGVARRVTFSDAAPVLRHIKHVNQTDLNV